MLTEHCFHKTKNVRFFTDFLINRLYMHKSMTYCKESIKYITNIHKTTTVYDINSKLVAPASLLSLKAFFWNDKKTV